MTKHTFNFEMMIFFKSILIIISSAGYDMRSRSDITFSCLQLSNAATNVLCASSGCGSKDSLQLKMINQTGLLQATYGFAGTWSYNPPFPPPVWYFRYPKCGFSGQSPIDIETKSLIINESLGHFNRSIFGTVNGRMIYKNNGHTLQIDLPNGYTIEDPMLFHHPYQVAQFHMHWGKSEKRGSEHTVNGRQYFGELHVVHYNTKYESIEVAATQEDGLAVCGFFIEDDYPQDNLEFNKILKPISNNNVNYNGDMWEVENRFSIEPILPHNLDLYYRYHGSLTTPPCDESVIWSVFAEPIRISKKQAGILRSLAFESSRSKNFILPLNGNFRPVQPLNGRIVTAPMACP